MNYRGSLAILSVITKDVCVCARTDGKKIIGNTVA